MKKSRSAQSTTQHEVNSNQLECLENRQLFAAHLPLAAGSGFGLDAADQTPAMSMPSFQQNFQQTVPSAFLANRIAAYEHFMELVQSAAFADPTASLPAQSTSSVSSVSSAPAATDVSDDVTTAAASTPRVDLDRAPATAVQADGFDTPAAVPANDTRPEAVVDSAKVIPIVAAPAPTATAVSVKIATLPAPHPTYAMASFPTAIPTSAVPSLMNLLSLDTAASVKAPSWMMQAASRITHADKQADTTNTTNDANAIQTDTVTAPNALLATLDIQHMATRPWWQRLTAATTTALLLIVTWYIRRRTKERSLAPAGERFSEI